MQNKIEESFINKFIAEGKRERYLGFIAKDKNRKKFTQELYHFKDLEWKLFREILGNENEKNIVLEKVTHNKAINGCYIISANSDFDCKTVSVKEAISEFIGKEATVLIFGNAEVIYYQAEQFEGRFISL